MIGMNYTFLEDVWPTEVTHARIWDMGVSWRDIHIAVDVYDWTRLDTVVDRMVAAGVNITYCVGLTPQWLAKYPTQPYYKTYYGPGSNSMPYSVDEFNKFIWNLATRYKGKIKNYEIWNEPQLAEYLYPYETAETNTLATMTQRAYNTIKSIDSTALVLSASLLPRTSSGGLARAQKYLNSMQLKGYPVDAWTCHIYPEGTTNQGTIWKNYYDAVKNEITARATGTNKIWVTETAFGLLQGPIAADKCYQYTEVVYTYMNSFVFWYAWNRPDLGGATVKFGSPEWEAIKTYHLL
jgi:hypothetical protein